MKRLVSAFLAGAMALSLAACGEKEPDDSPSGYDDSLISELYSEEGEYTDAENNTLSYRYHVPQIVSETAVAAALNAEYTLPAVSQTVIITRMEGRTPVPEKEKLASLASHGATMVIFLSISLIDKVQEALLQGAYTASTPPPCVQGHLAEQKNRDAAPLTPWPKAPSRRALPKRP